MGTQRLACCFLFLALAALPTCGATEAPQELRFEKEILRVRPSGEAMSQIPGQFKFVNQSIREVRILEIASSCTCTKASAARSVIEPGGSSEINVVFDGRGREGLQRKRLVVRTDGGDRLILTLVVELPSRSK